MHNVLYILVEKEGSQSYTRLIWAGMKNFNKPLVLLHGK